MSNEKDSQNQVSNEQDITEVESFNYEGYEVARGEFFAHLREPGITFAKDQFFVNSACLAKRPDTDYVLVLVNGEARKLIIKPCAEEEKDSIRWATAGKRRMPRHISCKVFYAKVFSLMNWDPDFRYKLIGKMIKEDGELMFIFDLNTPSVFVRVNGNSDKIKFSKTAKYPEEWKNQFGVSVKEHQEFLKLNFLDGYTIFGLQKDGTSGLKNERGYENG